MLREITTDEIIFRNVVSAKEGVIEYTDGKWYKPASEIKKAAENTGRSPLGTGTHEDWRDIGYVDKPKNGKPYKRGQMLRDWHFTKSLMTEEEMKTLLTGKKMDVSIGYRSDEVQMAGKHYTLPYDGVNTNISIDHFLWTQQGKCSEKDGCGLRRSDSADAIRYDAVVSLNKEDDKMDVERLLNEIRGDAEDAIKACVAKKTKVLAKEHPDWENKKVVAAAYSYCQKGKEKGKDEGKDKEKDKKTKGDSMTTDNSEVITPPDETLKPEELKAFMTEFDKMKEIVAKLTKQDNTEDDTQPPQTPPPTVATETGEAEDNKEVISSINTLKDELKDEIKKFKEFVEKSNAKRSSSFPLRGQDENE